MNRRVPFALEGPGPGRDPEDRAQARADLARLAAVLRAMLHSTDDPAAIQLMVAEARKRLEAARGAFVLARRVKDE